MDKENGGQSGTNDLQRQAASSIARKKVLAAYTSAAQKSYENHSDNASSMKNEKVNPTINSESWNRYHTAWQNYYQKYYSQYYSKAAQEYINRERLKDAREKEEEEEIILGKRTAEDKLRALVRKKATDSIKKTRRHKKLIPIIIGICVTLIVLFLQYNQMIIAPIMAYVTPGNVAVSEIESIDPTITVAISSDPRLIIPKINVDVPVHFGISLDEVDNAMQNGVAHYRIAGAEAFPGEIGNTAISGHSAGNIYNNNKYKYIFSGLERLDVGDLIYINYNSIRYTYRVTRKSVIEPTDVAALVVDTDIPILTLITCTPTGTSRYRLLVFADQISPEYDTRTTIITEPEEPAAEKPENLPSNDPTFFEGIWNWITGN